MQERERERESERATGALKQSMKHRGRAFFLSCGPSFCAVLQFTPGCFDNKPFIIMMCHCNLEIHLLVMKCDYCRHSPSNDSERY